MVAVLIVIVIILQGVFRILSWIAPLLFVLAVLINYRTVIGYGRTLLRLLKEQTLFGILAVILTVIGFPVVVAYLFGRSLVDRRIRLLGREYEKRREGEYVEYEDVTEDSDKLELPDFERRRERRSDYEDFLDS